MNFAPLLQNHVVADECGQDGIGQAWQATHKNAETRCETRQHPPPTVPHPDMTHRSSMPTRSQELDEPQGLQSRERILPNAPASHKRQSNSQPGKLHAQKINFAAT
jgi:hypothetical protein